MWTVEQLIGLGLFLAVENDIPVNCEIRLIPRAGVSGELIKLHKPAPVARDALSGEALPLSFAESDIVKIQAIGHPRIAETVYWGYSHSLNVLVIILDG